jgi:hypothetical protein
VSDLPDTEDPFQLLGVLPSAGEKALRKAYAQRIKQYPPDRAPDDFARIHAALERALQKEPPPKMSPPPLADPDGDGVYDRFVRLLDAGDYAGLWTELESPELFDEASKDAATGAALIRAAGVMTWHTPDAVALLRRFAAPARWLGLDELIDVATTEAQLAGRFHRLGGGAFSGDLLRSLFGDVLLASPTRRRATTAALIPALVDWRQIAMVCFAIDNTDRSLARVLTGRLQRESPLWGERALAPLPLVIRDSLVDRLLAFRDPARVRNIIGLTGGTAVGIGLFIAMHGGITIIPIAVGAGIARAFQRNIEERYRRNVHPQLAALVAELGVQADTIPSWLNAYPHRGRDLRVYLNQIEWDVTLALFASICALVREHERDVLTGPEIAAYR